MLTVCRIWNSSVARIYSYQFKSKNDLDILSKTDEKLGHVFIRNDFETSPAKGAKDAARGNIKRQTDLAELRGTTIIQSAKDMCHFFKKG